MGRFPEQPIHTYADQKHHRMDTFQFFSLPRELRDIVYGFIVPTIATFNRHSRVLGVAYLLANRQFASEIMGKYELQTFITDIATVATPRGLSDPILRYVYMMNLSIPNAFPGASFIAAAEGCTAMILHQSLRVLHLELTSLPRREPLVTHMRVATTGRCQLDPATGAARFWSSSGGQKLLDLVTHARLKAVSLRVAAEGHWDLFCPFHEPVRGGCHPVPSHWSGGNMVCVPAPDPADSAPSDDGILDNNNNNDDNKNKNQTTLAMNIASLPGWAEKQRDAAARIKVEKAYLRPFVAKAKSRDAHLRDCRAWEKEACEILRPYRVENEQKIRLEAIKACRLQRYAALNSESNYRLPPGLFRRL